MRYLIAFLLLASPAFAQCAPGDDLRSVIGKVESEGGKLLGLSDVPGALVDQIVLLQIGRSIVAGGVLAGCVVTPPLMLFEASSVGKPSLGV